MPKRPRAALARSLGLRAQPIRSRASPNLYAAARRSLRSVRDLVRFAVTRFEEAHLSYGHGSDNALDEAAYLVLHALRLPLDRLDAFMGAHLLPTEIEQVLTLLQRRVTERCPAAYLTREAWIGPHRFYVDERVIVPRSYLGHWLCGELAPWIDRPESVARVLELCTGSGCLAILAAIAFPAARIDAVDISTGALQVAARNVAEHRLGDRIRLLAGDLYAGVAKRRYDVIIANPPYVTQAAMRTLPAEHRHEPRISLAGGKDGLEFVRRILAGAAVHLTATGILIMEVGHARPQVESAFPRTDFTWLEIDGVDDAVLLLHRDQLSRARAPR